VVVATITIIARVEHNHYPIHFGETNNTGIFTRSWNRFKYSVTDANNCNAANGTFTVVEPEAIIATAITVDNSNCTVCSDGSINLTVTGGSLPYTLYGLTDYN
jgi:hypothetical protein